jgi:hypothetical protein
LEASWGVLEASWDVLEASWGVLEASWRRLGVVLGRFERSWGRLGASGARLSWDSILDTILYPICNRFSLDLATFETCEKALWYYKNSSFVALRQVPNQTEKTKKINGFWVLRGSIFPSWAALGGVQGVVLAILERLGGVLEPSWGICIKYMRCGQPLAGSNVDSGSPR